MTSGPNPATEPAQPAKRPWTMRIERVITVALPFAAVIGAVWWYAAWGRSDTHSDLSLARHAGQRSSAADAGVPTHAASPRATPPAPHDSERAAPRGVTRPVALAPSAPRAPEQGHGAEVWSRSDSEHTDFEPRYESDGGTLAEPAALAPPSSAPAAFH
jgi:hypothetical protein